MIDQPIYAQAASHTYPVYIGVDLWQSGDIVKYFAQQQVIIVTQQTIADLHQAAFARWFASCAHYDVIYLPEGEQYKNIDEWQRLLAQLQALQCDRKTCLVAIGGGMVGDMTGFAAACYHRGISYVQMPTTLIAQVDAAMGGKTGVNHANVKNLLGAFYPPQVVMSDMNWLSTLPEREFRAGLAEVIKYALIADADFFDWLSVNMQRVIGRDKTALHYLVYTCAKIKITITNQDERDTSGLRSLLNFGHTFGHAIESCADYQGILHGEAVAIGMFIAVLLSRDLEWLSQDATKKILTLLRVIPVEHLIAMLPAAPFLIEVMQSDKKVIQGRLYLVLLKSIGNAVLTADVSSEQIKKTLESNLLQAYLALLS